MEKEDTKQPKPPKPTKSPPAGKTKPAPKAGKEEKQDPPPPQPSAGEPVVTRLRKFRLAPSQTQRAVLELWARDANLTYNLCLAYVRQHKIHHFQRGQQKAPSWFDLKKQLRNNFVSAVALQDKPRLQRLLRTPKDIRDEAMQDLLAVLKRGWTMFKRKQYVEKKYPASAMAKHKWKFRPTFRPRRPSAKACFAMNGRAVSLSSRGDSVDIFRTWDVLRPFKRVQVVLDPRYHQHTLPKTTKARYVTRGILFATTERPGLTDLDGFLKLHCEHGVWSLLVPSDRVAGSQPVGDRDDVVALDPGIRKFLTAYSPQGKCEILGTNTYRVVDKLSRRIDRRCRRLNFNLHQLRCEKSTASRMTKHRHRNWVAKAQRRFHQANQRCTNTIKDLHYKVAHHLCRNYATIIYPYFNSHAIVKGKLHPITKRRANLLSFYKFSQRLIQTATHYSGTTVQRCSEAYTSMQCGQCGVLNETLGMNEVFNCGSCGLHMDRDVHGARNILLRALQPKDGARPAAT